MKDPCCSFTFCTIRENTNNDKMDTIYNEGGEVLKLFSHIFGTLSVISIIALLILKFLFEIVIGKLIYVSSLFVLSFFYFVLCRKYLIMNSTNKNEEEEKHEVIEKFV